MVETIIDSYVLNKFQKISDFVQDWFGVDNFKIAQIAFHLYVITNLLNELFEFKELGSIFWLCIGIIFFFIFFIVYRFLLRITQSAYSSNPQFQNRLGTTGTIIGMFRCYFFVFLVLSLFFLFFHLGHEHVPKNAGDIVYPNYLRFISFLEQLFEVCFVYFISCTPKPKKPSKFKKFIEKMKTSFSSQGQGTLVPNFVKI
ncbi:MAG: hypothetical protein MRY57_00245 [Candidatus Pacebacteria bacterium]|nr:hypothetical protein [Candidatus Paceibacterota bacterium]